MSLDIARMDTICARASAPGLGAIAIVRASGRDAEHILRAIFRRASRAIEPLVAMHGEIRDENEQIIDDVMAVFYPEHKGFTGEPSFEIFCHGNQLIVQEILDAICRRGARLAGPGEFSLRALLSGKIDLAQAESIADLIHAKSAAAKQVALRGVQGGLKDKTIAMRETIIAVLSEIEARMDFPDEDLGSYDKSHLISALDDAIENLSTLLKNANFALKLHEGARIVICGLPNAGKSTLLNRLCGEERAIVHETAGTTRDVIEAVMSIEGVPVVFVDVAGIRDVDENNPIEKIGIIKAEQEIAKAHVVIWLADATVDEPFGDTRIAHALNALDTPVVRVLNKTELLTTPVEGALNISAKLGFGISDLLTTLARHLAADAGHAEMFITRARQKEELEQAAQAFAHAREALALGFVDEVITSELRAAGLAFDRLFGTELSEDVLDRIFSQFCIGK